MKLHPLFLAPLAFAGTAFANPAVEATHAQLLAMFPKADAKTPEMGGYELSDSKLEKQADGSYVVTYTTFNMVNADGTLQSGPVKFTLTPEGNDVAITVNGTGTSQVVDAEGKKTGTLEGPTATINGKYSGKEGYITSLSYNLGDLKYTGTDFNSTIANASMVSTANNGRWPLKINTGAITFNDATATCTAASIIGNGDAAIADSAYKAIVDKTVAADRDQVAIMNASMDIFLVIDAFDLDIGINKLDCKMPEGNASIDKFRLFSTYKEVKNKGDLSIGLELLNAQLPADILPAGLKPERLSMNLGIRNVNPGFSKTVRKFAIEMQKDPAKAEQQAMGLVFGLMGSEIYVEDGEIKTTNSTVTHHGSLGVSMQPQGSYHVHIINIDALITDLEKVSGPEDDTVLMLKQLKPMGVKKDGGLQYDFAFTANGTTLNGKPFDM